MYYPSYHPGLSCTCAPSLTVPLMCVTVPSTAMHALDELGHIRAAGKDFAAAGQDCQRAGPFVLFSAYNYLLAFLVCSKE